MVYEGLATGLSAALPAGRSWLSVVDADDATMLFGAAWRWANSTVLETDTAAFRSREGSDWQLVDPESQLNRTNNAFVLLVPEPGVLLTQGVALLGLAGSSQARRWWRAASARDSWARILRAPAPRVASDR